MAKEKITLPVFKHPPPYEKTAWDWWCFFLQPHKSTLLFYSFINVIRMSFFRGKPLFLGILIGGIESKAFIENPALAFTWIGGFFGLYIIMLGSLAFYVPAGRLMDLIAKQIALFGFSHYLNLSESWHENKASGEKLQRLLKARDAAYQMMDYFLWHVLDLPTIALVIIVSMITISAPYYYIFLLCSLILAHMISSHITGLWMKERYEDYNRTLENVISSVYEFVVSTATVRFFNLKKTALDKGATLEHKNLLSRIEILWTIFKRWVLIDSLALTVTAIIFCLSTYQVIEQDISIAAYTTIIFLTFSIYDHLDQFAVIYPRMIEQWEGFRRLAEILQRKPSITDQENATKLDASYPDIKFEDVSFGYHKDVQTINKITANIKAGEKIGLIGPSGAGKSTIVKLLLRFYDINEGAIIINGQNIKNVTLESLQAAIAVIPQDTVMFNHSLIDNIRYGRLDASGEEIYEAARKAHAHEFIQDLPNGYNTIVGERGVKLSGGQRQRIAIARAILKDAPILLLDEATSALDSESEKFIQDSLKEMMQGKTVIAIAHRLSTISHLDRLIVMDQGKIIEDGMHEALLEKNGIYAKLWAMQSRGFLGE